jgi:hypothetical protein
MENPIEKNKKNKGVQSPIKKVLRDKTRKKNLKTWKK